MEYLPKNYYVKKFRSKNKKKSLKRENKKKHEEFLGKRIMTKEGKVDIHVLIPQDLYEMLLRIGPQTYGRGRGWLSAIVEEALREYLTPRAHTQMHTNPSHGVLKVWNTVVEKIKEILNMPIKPKEVPEKILDLAIVETRGSDPRTVAKWKRVFEDSGLIKHVGGHPPNRVFELFIV